MTIKEVLEQFQLEWEWTGKNCYGVLYREFKKISFNIYIYLVNTFLHEYHHAKYPESTEDIAEYRTQLMLSRMTDKQIKKLALVILKRIEETDGE